MKCVFRVLNYNVQARSNILRKWYSLMMENQNDLAKIITLEQVQQLTSCTM